MACSRADVVREALSWRNTPFFHQGRTKGIACDCVGLLCGVAEALAIPYEDLPTYAPYPTGTGLVDELLKWLEPAPGNPRPGDILVFWYHKDAAGERVPAHVGLLTDYGMIHSNGATRIEKVVEHRWTPAWQKHLYCVLQIPGVTG